MTQVSGDYGSRSHVSKTQSTWADSYKARMNEEDNKTNWSPFGLFDDARKMEIQNIHIQACAVGT